MWLTVFMTLTAILAALSLTQWLKACYWQAVANKERQEKLMLERSLEILAGEMAGKADSILDAEETL